MNDQPISTLFVHSCTRLLILHMRWACCYWTSCWQGDAVKNSLKRNTQVSSYLLHTKTTNQACTTEIHTGSLWRQICSQLALVAVQHCSQCLWCRTPAVSGSVLTFEMLGWAVFRQIPQAESGECASLPSRYWVIVASHEKVRFVTTADVPEMDKTR